MHDRPRLYIIAGPNGAGKTTFAMEYLPYWVDCAEFVNADLIAAGLSPFSSQTAAVSAGRAMLFRISELLARRTDFAVETTLASRGIRELIGRAHSGGYVVHLYYLWLPAPDIALARVAARVRQGGHDVPEPDVRRRYSRGLVNLWDQHMREVDTWMLIDNSTPTPQPIAWRAYEKTTVAMPETWRAIEAAVEAARERRSLRSPST